MFSPPSSGGGGGRGLKPIVCLYTSNICWIYDITRDGHNCLFMKRCYSFLIVYWAAISQDIRIIKQGDNCLLINNVRGPFICTFSSYLVDIYAYSFFYIFLS